MSGPRRMDRFLREMFLAEMGTDEDGPWMNFPIKEGWEETIFHALEASSDPSAKIIADQIESWTQTRWPKSAEELNSHAGGAPDSPADPEAVERDYGT